MAFNRGRPTMIGDKECDICFTRRKITINCFWGCSICICKRCISKIVKLTSLGVISFKCPQCKRSSFNVGSYYHLNLTDQEKCNLKFGRLCRDSKTLINKIYKIYEKKYDEYEEFLNMID